MNIFRGIRNHFFEDNSSESIQKISYADDHIVPNNFVAFDIEISRIVPGDFSHWRKYRPLGITCAATLVDGADPKCWYSTTENGAIIPSMIRPDLVQLVNFLSSLTESGYKIVTWNGLGFDFDVLAEESGMWDECRAIALNHVDMMFHLFCRLGYPLSLDKAAKGAGFAGKSDTISGELAPVYWLAERYQQVLDYVEQDVITTLQVAKSVYSSGKISWVTNRRRNTSVRINNGWLTVNQAQKLPLPDNSWMSSPMQREDFFGWTRINPIRVHHNVCSTEQEESSFETLSSETELESFFEKLGYQRIGKRFWPKTNLEYEAYNSEREYFEEEVDEDEYGKYFLEDDYYYFHGKKKEFEFNYDKYDDDGLVCPCPICRGTPNDDHVFRCIEENLDKPFY